MRIFQFLIILLICCAQSSFAQNYDDQAKKLESEIKRIQKLQEKDRKNQKKVRQQLNKTNKELKTVGSKLKRLDKDLKNQEELVSTLEKKLAKNLNNTAESRTILAATLVQYSKQQKPNILQILLSQSTSEEFDRQQTYLKYFTRARQQQINILRISSQTAESTNQEYSQRQKKLKEQYQQQKNLQKEIAQQNDKKSKTLKKLESGIAKKSTTIKKLKTDKKRLSALIKRLEEKRKQTAKVDKEFIPAKGGFSKQKSRLLLPVAGKVVIAYGQKQQPSGISSSGLHVKASKSGPNTVRAIYEGRVIFSNWLKGFGNLIIVEHGGGYMSLYGNNQVLNKKEGDVVAARETIATFNQRSKQNNFYFEIRSQGKPINPKAWLRK